MLNGIKWARTDAKRESVYRDDEPFESNVGLWFGWELWDTAVKPCDKDRKMCATIEKLYDEDKLR